MPTKWSLPYQSKVDKNGDVWTGGMSSDRITRINSKTGDMVEYPAAGEHQYPQPLRR